MGILVLSTFSIIKFSTRKPTTLSIFTNFLPVYSDKRNKQDHFNMRFSSVSVLAVLAVSAQAQNLDALTSNRRHNQQRHIRCWRSSRHSYECRRRRIRHRNQCDRRRTLHSYKCSWRCSIYRSKLGRRSFLEWHKHCRWCILVCYQCCRWSSFDSIERLELCIELHCIRGFRPSIKHRVGRFYRNRSRKEQSSQPSKQYQCRCRIEGQRSQCPYLKRRGRCYWNRIPYRLLHCRRCSDDCCSYLGCRYWCSFVSDLDGLHCIGVLAGELEHFIKRFLGHAF